MPHHVLITTGARLHFGLLAHAPGAGRQFGGAGLMVDRPGIKLAASVAKVDCVSGPEPYKSRVERHLAAYRTSVAEQKQPPGCRLEIQGEISAHVGLGSGTQLGMAVAQALAILAGEGAVPAQELARRVGRGARSALGIHGFHAGGFMVEAGKRRGTGLPTRPAQAAPGRVGRPIPLFGRPIPLAEDIGPLIARVPFPDDWRLVLVRPPETSGLSGEDEISAFANLPRMPAETTGKLCRILLMELLPAILEADFDTCGESLYEFGGTVGAYFSPAQGGVYANPRMAALVEHLRRQGIRGVGQTSWGPTLFALCREEREALALVAELAGSPWEDCEFTVAAPLNTGAALEFV